MKFTAYAYANGVYHLPVSSCGSCESRLFAGCVNPPDLGWSLRSLTVTTDNLHFALASRKGGITPCQSQRHRVLLSLRQSDDCHPRRHVPRKWDKMGSVLSVRKRRKVYMAVPTSKEQYVQLRYQVHLRFNIFWNPFWLDKSNEEGNQTHQWCQCSTHFILACKVLLSRALALVSLELFYLSRLISYA